MKLNEKIFATLLLTIGLLVHKFTPGIFLGMKMDFLLIALFISIILMPSMENYILSSLLAGLFSAITTTFPAGQIPNIIDKLVSGFIVYLLVRFVIKDKNNSLIIGIIGFIGTIISGAIFLFISKYIIGAMDIDIKLLYLVVLPAALINSIGIVFIYKIVYRSLNMIKAY